jgi:hypothetical protein
MAGQAVSLGMAGDTALQVLAGCLTVVEEEGLLGVMIAGAPQSARRDQAGIQVAVGTELPLVVAVTTRALPGVGGGRMTGEEARRMVAGRRIARVGSVAGQTVGTNVASAAALGTGRGRLGVELGEVEPV